MKPGTAARILATSIAIMFFIFTVTAQKGVDKAKETLAKAMEEKVAAKRQEMIGKAREELQKAGMKPQEIATVLGDAYLDKGDLVNAATAYGSANKQDKKDGLKKVADAYVESAFSGDEKNMAKSLNKAMDLYRKADAVKEGARGIGDKYYDKGPDYYTKALDYYITGEAAVKIEQIAKDFYSKGGENEDKAAEVYLKVKTPEAYQKAGDIFYGKKEYPKAIDAYQAGNDAEGIKKYAEYLYSENRNEEADGLFLRLADSLKDNEAIEKLATEREKKGNYGVAAQIYDKAGNTNLADKNRAYDKLIAFDFDSAKMFFNSINNPAMVKAIDDNIKQLTPLKDLAENFDEIMKGAPPVNMITDSVTGTEMPSATDQKTVEEYYKSVRDQIIKNVEAVSAGMIRLKDPELKKYARVRFLRYGAIRKILDNETFAIKKQKQDIRAQDIML